MCFWQKPRVIAEAVSEYSGKLRVVQGWGFRHLSTDKIQHSGGIVEEIWDKALKGEAKKEASWLVLGVAGGCVLKLVNKKYQPKKITGVEIDPTIIDLGKKYFGLDKYENLSLVVADANKYIYETNERFDYVLGDLFGTDSPPEFVYEKRFLKRLKAIGTKVFINHIYDIGPNKKKADYLIRQLQECGYETGIKRIMKNIVVKYT